MLKRLQLQNFRNYTKRNFEFAEGTTLIVGPNAIGKTNILEAIYALATGQSFRAESERDLIRESADGEDEGNKVARVVGKVGVDELELIWDGRGRFQKLYRINGVGRRQVDFEGQLRTVMFGPGDIEIVADSPSTRRRYLDSVLKLVYRDYRLASHIYERALRQRNRLLWRIKNQDMPQADAAPQLEYWSELLIENGTTIHGRRKEYLEFLSARENRVCATRMHYDHSVISRERLLRYRDEELAAATTLVGPQRDDFRTESGRGERLKDIKLFGSRGEQRLAVFEIKLGELEFVRQMTGEDPVLLLDDIFSELDHENRHLILQVIPKQQTIMTTTDLHLVEEKYWKSVEVVKLG